MLGGRLGDRFGQRRLFLIGIAGFTVASLACGLAWSPTILPRIPADPTVILDAPGSVVLSVAVLGLIAGLIEGPEFGWGLWPISLLTIGVAAFTAFCFRQAKARNPLILPSLLRNRGFTAGLAAGLGYFAVVTGLTYVVSLFCQQALHRDPVQTALTGIVPMSVGIIIASIIAAPMIGRLGRNLVAAGVATTAIGAGWLWLTVHNAGLAQGTWSLVGPMVVTGFGMGLTFGTLFDIALGDASPEEAGSAGGSLPSGNSPGRSDQQ